MSTEPTIDEKLCMSKKCDLKLNLQAKDKFHNIKIVDNSKIVSTDFISNNQIICVSDPLFNFNFDESTEDLLASLSFLSQDVIKQLINICYGYFYPRVVDDIIKGFKIMHGNNYLNDDLISTLMKQPVHMIN